MIRAQKIPWPRIFAEGIAIVVSILLAFWIQAWWEDRQLQDNERLILESLLTELTETQRNLRIIDSYAGGIRDASKQLLEAGLGSSEILSDADIDRLIGETTWYIPVDFLATPELDSLVLSDDLWLIENSDLQRLLRIWPKTLIQIRTAIVGQYELFRDRHMPFLEAHASMQQIKNTAFVQPGTGIEWPGEISHIKEPISHRSLLSDRELLNLLSQRITWITEIIEFVPAGTQGQLDEIIILIERELDKT
jgi:hypothetical protein